MKSLILIALVMSVTLGCSKKEEDGSSLTVNSVEAVVESGVTMLSGMADEESGSSLALETKANELKPSIFEQAFVSRAYADSCSRAYYQSCSSGVRSVDYNACTVPYTLRSLNGNVTLTYSDSSCSMATTGNTTTRTYNIDITGTRGGKISHSSDTYTDYSGDAYGGGGRLTKTGSGWNLDILGRHTQFTYNGLEIFNVSTRTLSPVSVTGSLSRSSRVMSGGQIEVNHNLAAFTATMVPQNLQWSGSCCHPISGSLDVTFSGSKTGTATVTFAGCGTATVDQDGQSNSIQLLYCE